MPSASLTQVTVLAWEQVPISVLSGEQIDCPGVEQGLVVAPDEAEPDEVGAALEVGALLPAADAVSATGAAMTGGETAGAATAIDGAAEAAD